MNTFEKTYSIFGLFFAVGLITSLVMFPRLRELDYLILVCSAGFVVNVGLLFIVLRDIFLRSFDNQGRKFFWLIVVLLFWPSIVYYLPKYGFQPRII
ncbi:MAG: hypothetical protein ACWGOX_02890 [Desulforhopalus sp.]